MDTYDIHGAKFTSKFQYNLFINTTFNFNTKITAYPANTSSTNTCSDPIIKVSINTSTTYNSISNNYTNLITKTPAIISMHNIKIITENIIMKKAPPLTSPVPLEDNSPLYQDIKNLKKDLL